VSISSYVQVSEGSTVTHVEPLQFQVYIW
jgi:hypothetical protein